MAWLVWALPVNQALAPLPEPSVVLLDRHDVAFARRGALKEAPVDSRLLPKHLIDAVVSIEDRRFFHHLGIDPLGIFRAMLHNARAGQLEQGGSTITQQLAKTSFLSADRTLRRKVQEALIAQWLEFRLDKHEILSRYLSSIYFGDGVYGLRAAARHYFDVAPEDLDLAQSAMLAGMIKAPSALSPTQHPREARARAQTVIRAMVDNGVLSADQARALRPARVRIGGAELPVGSYFADWISSAAKDAFAADYGDVPVRTTLDLELQQYAERVVERALRSQGRAGGVTQVALIAMRPDGEVLAMVGGRNYAASAFNRATQAQRQPGSAFKLFVYYAAVRAGVRPDDYVDDLPITVGDWSPSNYGDSYRGPIPVRQAFAQSSNVAAVRLAQTVGAPAVVQSARDLGITSELGTDASLALGSYETTLMELTAAYASIAAGAAPVVPYGVLEHPPLQPRRLLSPEDRAMMLDLLWSAVENGTGRSARLRIPAFGKTGTTQDYRDALFVGMAGDLVTGVWVGNDDNTPMHGVTGGTLPAQIWHDFMIAAAPSASPEQTLMQGWRGPSMEPMPDYRQPPRRSHFADWARRKFGWGRR
jgi:penicillin-binding protein 1A